MKTVKFVKINGIKKDVNLSWKGAQLNLSLLKHQKEVLDVDDLKLMGIMPELLTGDYDLNDLSINYLDKIVRNFVLN